MLMMGVACALGAAVYFSSYFSIYKSSLVVESGVKHHNPMPIPLYWDYLLTGLNHLGSRIPMA
jgi:hypothetical protein